MNLHSPQFSATDVLQVAKIDHNTLQNWLRHGLLDRLGVSRPTIGRQKYSLLDVLSITAEAQLAFHGIGPKARNETHMAEAITAKCMALLNNLQVDPILNFTIPTSMGVRIVVDCGQLTDYVLHALEARKDLA